MITNVEFMHQRSCSWTCDNICDHPKVVIFLWPCSLGLAGHLEVRVCSRIRCENFLEYCKRVGKWEHFCNQKHMHLDWTACHQKRLFF